ncbi:HrpW-specific chaperone [Pseudomonas fluorescens]|uniref:HrpW-specific chaperone n=1 Tax=Pseudomonas fluorescens TaxID=294 RepID=A0A944DJC9_PSEFL|nr:HrpW-specific chaperone [Pseudomonas fluorescens]MBT2298547.1 HrpW-specific chaperone [Pseudomonas fluorescens]MBT2310072.1 HrpW-specific chaperone [Pseudomonas fluorescens]MBT2311096.1 HrpW-specific chaperone [Pseudomonas fluorescens]MBT2319969.1 HrpW-specific chaperone [Pseudomonas fluorescens]MBT2329003.1 HrpW-specific chaperone [Pseudomonas fluorescens]
MSAAQTGAMFPHGSWKGLVRGDGYLSAEQRLAYERAIDLVTESLRDTLEQPASVVHGRFNLSAYIDSLEGQFQRNAKGDEVRGDAALTAFWILRILSDRLLTAGGIDRRW